MFYNQISHSDQLGLKEKSPEPWTEKNIAPDPCHDLGLKKMTFCSRTFQGASADLPEGTYVSGFAARAFSLSTKVGWE